MEQFMESTLYTEFLSKGKEWLISDFPGLLIVLILFFIAMKIIRISFRKLRKTLISRAERDEKIDTVETEKRINTLTSITRGLLVIVLWVVFLMIFLQKFGVNIAPVLASAGIIGLAIGFGAQELVRDFISGFFMILENQIRAGDVAIINGTGGLVEKIEFRTTTLRDLSGVVHVFQNGKINTISNMTKDWSAMVFDIGVAYKENPQEVLDIMKQVGDEMQNDPEFSDKIIEPIEISGLDKFGDSALVMRARIKTKPIQQWAVGREYRKRLKYAFDEHNIEIPFPHTTIYWGDKINPLKVDVGGER